MSFLLFFPFSLFVAPVSPRLSLLTVRVLKRGTGELATQWIGDINKGYILVASVFEEGFFGCIAKRRKVRWVIFFIKNKRSVWWHIVVSSGPPFLVSISGIVIGSGS